MREGNSTPRIEDNAADIAFITSIEKSWDQKGNPQTIEVNLKQYEGHPYLDIRLYAYSVSRDRMVPTPKGVTIGMRQLPQFVRAIREVYRHAEALGLMVEDS
jgi:hypothetical protein